MASCDPSAAVFIAEKMLSPELILEEKRVYDWHAKAWLDSSTGRQNNKALAAFVFKIHSELMTGGFAFTASEIAEWVWDRFLLYHSENTSFHHLWTDVNLEGKKIVMAKKMIKAWSQVLKDEIGKDLVAQKKGKAGLAAASGTGCTGGRMDSRLSENLDLTVFAPHSASSRIWMEESLYHGPKVFSFSEPVVEPVPAFFDNCILDFMDKTQIGNETVAAERGEEKDEVLGEEKVAVVLQNATASTDVIALQTSLDMVKTELEESRISEHRLKVQMGAMKTIHSWEMEEMKAKLDSVQLELDALKAEAVVELEDVGPDLTVDESNLD